MFTTFVLVRSVSVYFNLIWDCDETYNYWEPLHFLLHGSGLQTWEYSPIYGLRSYLYIILHALPLWPLRFITSSKIIEFYALRFVFALVISYFESLLYSCLKPLSKEIAYYYAILSLTNVGMFLSSTSFLPSTFTMYFIIFAYANWLFGSLKSPIFAIGVAVLLGWPFVFLLGLPMVVDYLFFKRLGIFKFTAYVVGFGVAISVPILLVDSYLYGRVVFAPLNIFLYNVFSPKGGPDLYGREPFSYYVKNCLLNFNLLYPISISSVALIVYDYVKTNNRYFFRNFLLVWLALFGWLAVFMTRPHKEERFLYPVYPLFLILASVGLMLFGKHMPRLKKLTVYLTLSLHLVFSLMRLLALLKNYSASIDVYVRLNEPFVKHNSMQLEHKEEMNVCVGKEWYRYPSSFFLPEKISHGTKSQTWTLRFVKADFGGQLPGYFRSDLSLPQSTRYVDKLFNDENKMVKKRFYPLQKCDYFIDTQPSDTDFTNIGGVRWKSMGRYRFLNASVQLKHSLLKAFYVPHYYEKHVPLTYFQLFQKS